MASLRGRNYVRRDEYPAYMMSSILPCRRSWVRVPSAAFDASPSDSTSTGSDGVASSAHASPTWCENSLHDEPPHSHAPTRLLLLALIVLLTIMLGWVNAAPANAHEPGRAECRTYQSMHLLITGSRVAAARMGKRCRIAAAAHVLTHPLPNSMIPPVMRRVRECESGGSYTAQNPTSTASGAWQYLDSTWGGHRGFARAMDAPPRVQDLRAIRDFRIVGTTPWAASRGCWS
jgi:hypothetical protein